MESMSQFLTKEDMYKARSERRAAEKEELRINVYNTGMGLFLALIEIEKLKARIKELELLAVTMSERGNE